MQELTFHTAFLRGAAIHPDKVAVIDGDHQATHAEHRDRVLRLCAVLRDLDIGPDDRFAVLSGNNHAYLELWHAAGLGAGVINPLNIRLSPVELAYILRDSGTDVVFCDATYLPVVELLQADGVKLREVVLVGEGGRYEQLLAGAEPWLPAEPAEDDLCILMYTGGTTGLPKGVALTHRNLALCLYHMTMSFKLNDSFRFLIFLAMFHVAGREPGHLRSVGRRRDRGDDAHVRARGGHGHHRGARHHRLRVRADDAGHDPAAPRLPPRAPRLAAVGRVRRRSHAPGPPHPAAHDVPRHGHLPGLRHDRSHRGHHLPLAPDHRLGGDRLRSVGLPMAGVRFSIRGPEGDELSTGEIGEVCLRGGTVMRELPGPARCHRRRPARRLVPHGDAGYLDDGGYLFVVDRVKDMIVSGGENVYSSEVENALSTHPAVGSVAVIGVPHDVWGEAVHAIVVVRADAEVTEDELKDHARLTLAGYKVPKTVELRDDPLPLSAAGKVLKGELRRPYWEW